MTNEKFDEIMLDDFEELDENFDNNFEDTDTTEKEPENPTIITAMDWILDRINTCPSISSVFRESKKSLAFLRNELKMTNMQICVLTLLVEAGEPLSWRKIGRNLGMSRLSVMTYSEEIEELVSRRWVMRKAARELGGNYQAFALVPGVVTALRHNKPYVPENIEGLTIQQFMDRVESYVDKAIRDHNIQFEDTEDWLMQICKANKHLPLCHTALMFDDDIHVFSLLIMAAFDYAQWAECEGEGMTYQFVDNLYPDDYSAGGLRHSLRNNRHTWIELGYLEHACNDGIADPNRYMITSKFKNELLQGYKPSKSRCPIKSHANRNLKSHSLIKAKQMYYNPSDKDQIDMLTNLLSKENLPGVQSRLEEEGMRKGFACLFYGAPGTGKTETVLQIARQTGRDIMQIDIAGMRDKFVGESEKNIKAVFQDYREACKNCEVMPILFFNEADALINKRTEHVEHSVDKMDNAMQNIILQEIEDLDGILIATTNLTSNLDNAFERRFLFKINFHKPDIDIKTALWLSMLGEGITTEDAKRLASRYDFSGGQIENIARKRTIDYILTGKRADVDEIEEFCKSELFGSKAKTRNAVGFTAK